MDTDAIIGLFGGPKLFGDAIGVSRNHAGAMKTRGSIPPEHWPAVIQAAQDRGIDGVTADALMQIAAKNAARRKATAETTAAAGEAA